MPPQKDSRTYGHAKRVSEDAAEHKKSREKLASVEHQQCRSTAQLKDHLGKMKGVFERFKTEHNNVLVKIPEDGSNKERAMALEI